MADYSFQRFIDLIKFDQESYRLLNQKTILESELEKLDKKKEQLAQALEDTKQTINSLKKKVDANELLIQELEQAESEEKKRLDSVANQREYRSVQAELASINRRQQEVEQQLIELWNRYETLKKQHEVQEVEYANRINEIDKTISERHNLINEILDSLESRLKERQLLEKDVPQEWLEKYAAMRAQVSNPVVAVENDSCTACFYPVSRQDLMQLRANKLVQCRSCYRLLYLKEEGLEKDRQKETKT